MDSDIEATGKFATIILIPALLLLAYGIVLGVVAHGSMEDGWAAWWEMVRTRSLTDFAALAGLFEDLRGQTSR